MISNYFIYILMLKLVCNISKMQAYNIKPININII